MRQIATMFLALGLLAGCAGIQNAVSTATNVTIPAEPVVLAISTFDAVKVTATNYLRAPRCSGLANPICRDPNVTKSIAVAIASGTSARNRLKNFMRTHQGQLGLKGDYDALVAATSTIQDLTVAFKVATGK